METSTDGQLSSTRRATSEPVYARCSSMYDRNSSISFWSWTRSSSTISVLHRPANVPPASSTHVLAAVITASLDDGDGARVAHAESLRCQTSEESLAGSGSVQADVSNDHILFGPEVRPLRRVSDNASAGETLSDVIVRVAFEFKSDARGKESTERLTGRPVQHNVDSVVR
ncbi:MAG: hypothetical protein BJ554DRAFT_6004 [Olpidium bornovanus]|uniref:Uncharacterized protein n=1 Tax=Olpidium bornovanus TaxID=278681 RepID=A0A8H8DKK1_9FUNG|nr:MAG: hypothetical protein BJ554DRAFT_6004 [Olpidium bornovanus]